MSAFKTLAIGFLGALLAGLLLIAVYQFHETRMLAKSDHDILATLCGRVDMNTRGAISCR